MTVGWRRGWLRPGRIAAVIVAAYACYFAWTCVRIVAQSGRDEARTADAIVVFAPKTLTMLQFNNEACRRLGYSRKEFAKLQRMDEYAGDTMRAIALVLTNNPSDGFG